MQGKLRRGKLIAHFAGISNKTLRRNNDMSRSCAGLQKLKKTDYFCRKLNSL
jgi:hypothetical protein